jgi:hypothetical protein
MQTKELIYKLVLYACDLLYVWIYIYKTPFLVVLQCVFKHCVISHFHAARWAIDVHPPPRMLL